MTGLEAVEEEEEVAAVAAADQLAGQLHLGPIPEGWGGVYVRADPQGSSTLGPSLVSK